MKKKVLHIVEAFGGGVFTFLVDLVNNTCDEYDIVLACSIRPQTPNDYRSYIDKRVKIIELESGIRDINLNKDIKSFIEIRKLIKSEKPDILHLHSSKSGFLGRMACNDRNVKVLYNPHGFAFLKEDESNLKKKIYKILEYVAAKKCGSIIGVSKGEYKEALKLSKKSYVINNGIDISKLPKLDEKIINTNNLKVCTVGRISYQKNPELFNKIAEEFPNIEFTWIGEGEMKEKLSADNIEITGWMNKKEVLKKMNDSDIFILTSLWEGLPIALLEGMYYKKICIVSNVIGNRDVIINGENGFVASNLEEFILIIKEIKAGNVDSVNISKKAYKDILERHNFENTSSCYKKIYSLA
ncbi:glycosyltransferase [Clostridium sp. D43t1_170807_H7]|uniref:glycosyltransferase n=1 Tax=Clostridium sp. D43t1_170807_H7 TaxID=2787140 RepID=UPI00189A654D|nr:glycosyltransferase [Clostridium sp. D43t1_170807_H7]